MLGRSDPNGNGRLALALMDSLLARLKADGVLSEEAFASLLAQTEERLVAEHSITSEGALIVLRDAKLGA